MLIHVHLLDAINFFAPCPLSPHIDPSLLTSLPDMIDSPYVKLDPALRLLYYNLVFHGRYIAQSTSAVAGNSLYFKCLREASAWHKTATGSVLDVVAAYIMVRPTPSVPLVLTQNIQPLTLRTVLDLDCCCLL